MGAVPVVLEGQSHGLKVGGLTVRRERTIASAELDELLHFRQALATTADVNIETSVQDIIAMWFGKRFLEEAKALGVPAPITSERMIETAEGFAWLAPKPEVHARLLAWLERAFRQSIKHASAELARLMVQVMPDHELTRAAIWRTAPPHNAERELAWFARLERDAGRNSKPVSLRERFEQLCRNPPYQGVRILPIIGKAGSGHREAAEKLRYLILHRQPNVELVSFGEFLRQQWRITHARTATQRELQQFGEQLVRFTPFAFTRDVIAQKPIAHGVLIVDGVRHRVISDAIHLMFESTLDPFAVVAPDELVVRRLSEREGRSHVRAIQEDATERDIPELLRSAKSVLHYDKELHLNEAELREATERANV
jgi:hypothetical protein